MLEVSIFASFYDIFDFGNVPTVSYISYHTATQPKDFSIGLGSCFHRVVFFSYHTIATIQPKDCSIFLLHFGIVFQCDIYFSFYYSTIRYFHDSLIAETYWPVITRSICKIIPNKAGYEKFTINMSFDVAIYKTKTHGTSNLQNIEDSSSKLEWKINYNY